MSSTTNTEIFDVAVVLVGLNSCDYIMQCVGSLYKADWRGMSYEIIYVDNGSVDQTLAMLKKDYPEVKLIANPTNLGYCKAANQGAAIADARHLFFLNDDTIVLDDAIPLLVEFLDRNPDAGIVGSRLFYPDMTEQWSGRKFPTMTNAILGRRTWLSKFFPNSKAISDYLCKEQLNSTEPFEVDWVSAAALMVDRHTFASVGGFAEDYYYWHEPVFCDRALRKGKKVYLHPRSKIIHYEGKGSGPRPHKVRLFHIRDFNDGAYRCYCEHFQLGPYSPMRWFAFTALKSRAALLMAGSWVRSLREA